MISVLRFSMIQIKERKNYFKIKKGESSQGQSGDNKDTTWTFEMAKHWREQKPPVRPSSESIRIIEQLLDSIIARKGSEIKVLILGATPEYRDLIIARNIRPTIVDYSDINYSALGLLMNHGDPQSHESFIQQNWITMKLSGRFDFIMADHSINVVSNKSVPDLLQNVSNCMKSDAIFVARTWIRPRNRQPNILEVIENYRKNVQKTGKPLYPTCVGPIQNFFYDKKKNRILLSDLGTELKKLYQAGVINDIEWEPIIPLHYDEVSLSLFIPTESELEKMVNVHLKTKNVYYTKETYNECCPIYVFEKNH